MALPVSLGPPPWSRAELIDALPEFVELYRRRPIAENTYGMRSPHLFAAWSIARRLDPEWIVESGVLHGQGTWFLEQAAPRARLVCIDPAPGALRYRSERARYLTEDFAAGEWPELPRESTLLFFDDHQPALPRVRRAAELGFRHLVFEDNYPPGQGDCHSLKQAWEAPDEAACLRQVLASYHEFPPVARDATTRWGDPWTDERYPTPPALLERPVAGLEPFFEEARHYTWICYATLKSR